MSHQSEHTDQQHQNGSSVLQVVVQFPGHPAQTQQADHLQGAEQTADALRERKEGEEGREGGDEGRERKGGREGGEEGGREGGREETEEEEREMWGGMVYGRKRE